MAQKYDDPGLRAAIITGVPSVSVPVLSKANTFALLKVSMCNPPLNRTPCRAALLMAEMMLTGVEMTRAHGQEMTSNVNPR